MNDFGGNWTQIKIDLFMKYVPAYLNIMHGQISKNGYTWKLMYFDGFAGSGLIGHGDNVAEGVAVRVLSISEPRVFDLYYFVENDEKNAEHLKRIIKEKFSDRKSHVVSEDFNIKIPKFVDFLKKEKHWKVLLFVDPFGMEVQWKSIEMLKNFAIDMWILIPTGIGVNRLLKKDGEINEAWFSRLQNFLGLSEEEIKQNFYKSTQTATLFEVTEKINKEKNAVEKAHALYKMKLLSIFDHVSEAYVMRNSQNSIMYHFLLASNNQTAVRIANSIVGKDITKL